MVIELGTVKELNRHPLPYTVFVNTSFLINATSTLLKLYETPLSNKRPHENYS